MRDFVFSVAIFLSTLFFSITSLFGVSYSGSSSSNVYVYISAGVALISVLLVLIDFLKNAYVSLSELVSCFIIVNFALIGAVSGYHSSPMFGQFVLFCVPSSFIALYYARRKTISSIVKWLDVWMLVISLSFIVTMPALVGDVIDQTAWYSQTMSYDAACAVLLNLYLMVYGKQYVRFKFFSSSFYKMACWLLLLVQLVALFLGGGRGAIVVVFVGAISLMHTFRKRFHKSFMFFIVAISFLVAGFYLIYQKGDGGFTYVLEKNMSRSFSMFDNGETMYDRTSGRNTVYSESIHAIEESPIVGYGLFRYVEQIKPQPYPHNIVLEWALQYGVLFAVICLCMVILLINKFRRIKKNDSRLVVLTPLMVVPFVQLLFSGSYLQTPLFWFIVIFLFNYKPCYSK